MIHLFSLTCKLYKYKIKNCNELYIISELAGLKPDDERCPECKAPSFKFIKNGYYNRHFVHMANGNVNDSILKIHEIKCSSCGRSHALLNFLIIPYSPYSIGFIITLIYLRITRKIKTISSLCDLLGISERTYYRLMQRLLSDLHALMHIMKSYDSISDRLLSMYDFTLDGLSEVLKTFKSFTGHFFMQRLFTLLQNTHFHFGKDSTVT